MFFYGRAGFNTDGVFYARLAPDVKNQDQLLRNLFYSLWLPGYFGFNWNALDDVLNDFSWIEEDVVVLEHASIKSLNVNDLFLYLKVLDDAVHYWENDSKKFLVYFSKEDEETVKNILSNHY